jgi:hypothetical protein
MEKEGGDCISFVWIEREGDGRITFPSGTFFLSFFFPTTSLTVLKTFGISGDSTCYQSKSLGKKGEENPYENKFQTYSLHKHNFSFLNFFKNIYIYIVHQQYKVSLKSFKFKELMMATQKLVPNILISQIRAMPPNIAMLV